jgi:2-methylisocitrate lyase-like PEP mutase family enzyme
MMSAPEVFRDLHRDGCFLLPNPWDAGSARYLEHVGYQALATTSSGMAWSHARSDGAMAADEVLDHVASIVAATSLPVNADFEHGYSHDVEEMAANVRRCAELGVGGLSIEDSTGDPAAPLFSRDDAARRIAAARAAIDASGTGAVLTARAESFLTGHPDPLPEAIDRLRSFIDAGADCVYAPRVSDPSQARELIEAVAPTPVNLLAVAGLGSSLEELAALGARRVSVGGTLARVAWKALSDAAIGLRAGDLSVLWGAMPGVEIDTLFRT